MKEATTIIDATYQLPTSSRNGVGNGTRPISAARYDVAQRNVLPAESGKGFDATRSIPPLLDGFLGPPAGFVIAISLAARRTGSTAMQLTSRPANERGFLAFCRASRLAQHRLPGQFGPRCHSIWLRGSADHLSWDCRCLSNCRSLRDQYYEFQCPRTTDEIRAFLPSICTTWSLKESFLPAALQP